MSTASPLTAPTTEQVSGFTLHIEHVPASLSHRELHRPMPIMDIIGAVRDGKQTCINQEAISLMAVLIEHLTKPAFNHTTQHRFLILAQSRKLALSILHGNAFCTQLQAHFKPITGTAHQPKDDAQPCHASVFLCYPEQEEPLCPRMMQQDQRQTNRPDIMAHIFTPEEVTRLIQQFPAIHTPHSTTEPAITQEKSVPAPATGMTLMWPRLSAPATRTQYLHHTGGPAHPHSVEAAASIQGVATLTPADILPADGNQEPTAYQRAQAWLLDIQHHVIKDAACYPFEQRYFLLGTSLQHCVDLLFASHLAYPFANRFDYLTAECQTRQEQAKASHRAIYFCTTDAPEALREIIHQYNPYRPGQKYAEAQLLAEDEFCHILEYYNIHTAPEHSTEPAARQNFYMTSYCDPRNTTHLPYDPAAALQYLHTTPADTTPRRGSMIFSFICLVIAITVLILLN